MTSMTIRDALNQAHRTLLEGDETVVVIGEDIKAGVFGVTSGLAQETYGDRILNVPISETAFVGMALGAAMTGLKPIVEIMFCDFMGVCFDQIFNQAAKLRFMSDNAYSLPLVIRTTMGAGDGSAAMHSQSLQGLLLQVPGLVVACPSNPADAAGLLKAGLDCPDPVILMEHKGLYDVEGAVSAGLPAVPLGKGNLVHDGQDCTLVAVSAMVPLAKGVAEALAAEGIGVDVIDPRTLQPFDWPLLINSLEKTGRLIVVDEGAAYGGFADMVISTMSAECFPSFKAPPVKLVPPHTPVPYATALEATWCISADQIEQAVRSLVGKPA